MNTDEDSSVGWTCGAVRSAGTYRVLGVGLIGRTGILRGSTAPQEARRGARSHPRGVTAGENPGERALSPKLSFLGEISTNGATQVKYTWATSDGRSWPTHTLNFTSATEQDVTTTWQLGVPGKTVKAWILLQVLFPNNKASSKYVLDFKCAK